jgi:hypothetical protein
MVATALETAGERATLFLEEPELHLHPGAQRYLAERLLSDTRQVFVTTHSSIFVNLEPPHSLYRVQTISGLTQVQRVEGSTDLAVLMEDIGARNSDLLLSDAVLFVEGMSDREIRHFWFHTLGQGLIEGNITVLATGGGRGAERQAVARSSVLVEISRRAPVPHLFLIDRDERRHGDFGRLQQQLEARIHVLKRREIENYLLVPRAIIAAMLRKYEHDADVFAKVQATTEEEVQQLISEGANQLHDLVLLKRVKAEIGGLADGLLPTNMISELIRRAHDHDLANHLHEAIRKRVDDELTRLNLDAIVLRERNTLDEAWGETESILSLAPGSEILEYVFASYGGRFKKASDGPRIAQAMKTEEIDEEIRELLGRISRLAPSKMSGDPQNDH